MCSIAYWKTIAKCTTDLCVVVLENSATLTEVATKWKTEKATRQWEIEISEDISLEENLIPKCTS